MVKILILSSVLILTGCGTLPDEHNKTFNTIASWHDRTDPCQYVGKDPGYKLPKFCGASSGKTITVTKSVHTGSYIINRD